jgi:hypothetical protein
MKLKSKSVLVRVEFQFLYASFSFEGYIADLDWMTLRIKGIALDEMGAPELVLSALSQSTFSGELREEDERIALTLLISRPSPEGKPDAFRFFIEGEWIDEDKNSHPRIN